MPRGRYAEAWRQGFPAVGTDARLPLDGRWSLATCRRVAERHFNGLNTQLGKGYTSYSICAASGFNLTLPTLLKGQQS